MTPNIALEKCPFCRDTEVHFFHNGDGMISVQCSKCGGNGGGSVDYYNAARKWNFASTAVADKVREVVFMEDIDDATIRD